mmetsp:Transcript_96639/g.171863  ORF Transcript_96639/g.171863 Transcript_96639/m.171863 type:complete len:715 (+) Transcript_96639:122-2266(+)
MPVEVSGSYVIEARAKNSYDLVAYSEHGSQRFRAIANRSKNIYSAKERHAGQRWEQVKCTELEGLNSFDKLLVETKQGFRSRKSKTGHAQEKLKLPAIQPRAPPKPRRVRPARGLISPLISDPPSPRNPSDEEFREWITLPALKPVLPSKASQKVMVDSPPATAWYLLLLRHTFDDDPNLKTSIVADCLHQVLDLPTKQAQSIAEEARKRPMVGCQRYDSWEEVTQKAESLSMLGLATQVVSAAGLSDRSIAEVDVERDAKGAKKGKRSGRGEMEYPDLFAKTLQRRQPVDLKPRMAVVADIEHTKKHRKQWRGAIERLGVDVLAKDPVKEVLEEEADAEAEQSPREQHGPMQGDSEIGWRRQKHRKHRLKELLLKHKMAKETVLEEDKSENLKLLKKSGTGRVNLDHWNEVVGQFSTGSKIPQARREACEMMRFFVFGEVGNEGAKTVEEKDRIFEETIGTMHQVQILFNVWQKLDDDQSGRADIKEFRAFADGHVTHMLKEGLEKPKNNHGKGPSWAKLGSTDDVSRFTNKLIKNLEQLLLASKSSFIIEDIMRIIWPSASITAIIEMRRWCTDMSKAYDRQRLKTPPVLPEAELEGLKSVFRHFDIYNRGELQVEELVATGLMAEREAKDFIKNWDRDGNGSLDVQEFCEMLCPTGYRAFPESQHGSLEDGTRVIYDPTIICWRLVQDSDDEAEHSSEDEHSEHDREDRDD